jgi:hypothetical protein
VTVRVAGSDGHSVNASGLKRLHVEMSETDGYRVEELVVSAEGETRVTYFSEDAKGNLETARSEVIRIDKTAPVIAGVPERCELWPPNHQMVRVADITASDDDDRSGVAALSVSGSSDDVSDEGDIAISGGTVELRAEKAARGRARTYGLTAVAVDGAGNTSTASWTCEVPHSRS